VRRLLRILDGLSNDERYWVTLAWVIAIVALAMAVAR